jgi:hypothetical protein
MRAMWRREQTPLPAPLREALDAEVMPLGTLQEVVRWGFAQKPPRDVAEVVVQDELCHDVVIPWREAVWLAFDTT